MPFGKHGKRLVLQEQSIIVPNLHSIRVVANLLIYNSAKQKVEYKFWDKIPEKLYARCY